ncbi:hypothetical protein LTR70_006755 [Exophiala xenobiotica]|uniref:Uncharacterized protein n=1 Tax=Lithohypha guttulata TaxID=1690604 RepID=A0ABR0KAD3_9EURO|nr:hypothetical protein LTR24_005021 [Lithohypha guttulata]KAK5315416.1 hypothetical protein LTR70_006755 [Exophiala xenobiotica]
MPIPRSPPPTTTKSKSDQIQIFDPPKHPAVAPSYSQISTVPLSPTTKLVTIAGQVGHDYTNPAGAISQSFPEQIRIALRNVETCLAAAGASKRDIISNRQLREEIVTKWFGKDRDGLKPPPDTLIGVESLASTGGKREYLFEIEVTAVVQTETPAEEKARKWNHAKRARSEDGRPNANK